MQKLKRAGVYAGAAVGGVIGGTVSFVGKVIRQPEIDQLGENIVDSAILTGEIAGYAMSGAADVVSGAVKRDKTVIKAGGRDLKKAGVAVGKNVVANASVALVEAGNVAIGLKTGDKARVVKGLKTMGKMAAIEFLTVGAIQMNETKTPEKSQENVSTAAEKKPAVVRVICSGPKTARIHPPQEEIDAHRSEAIAAVRRNEKPGLWKRIFG
ncbi:MAG: hypothetical protein IJ486_03090 [Firmicutes bacterium]|nr:hypothetical protein [Bacillota bacterium]